MVRVNHLAITHPHRDGTIASATGTLFSRDDARRLPDLQRLDFGTLP